MRVPAANVTFLPDTQTTGPSPPQPAPRSVTGSQLSTDIQKQGLVDRLAKDVADIEGKIAGASAESASADAGREDTVSQKLTFPLSSPSLQISLTPPRPSGAASSPS